MDKKKVLLIGVLAAVLLLAGGVSATCIWILNNSEKVGIEDNQEVSFKDENVISDIENKDGGDQTVVSSLSSTGLGTGKNDTGNLSAAGNGYEGIEGTGDYNYGEALQKSLLFYELQRAGDLPDETRCNWRGDSALTDGSDVGLDLTGGWFDAGDNVKFNLPMAYTSAILGWSIYEDKEAYVESGQLEYALANIKWANDYFIKCHPEDEVYYYQVGDGGQDHSYWGAAETVSYRMERPSYKVTKSAPGSTVCAETAASLAVCSIVYADIDKAYSDLCLGHAKALYKFARDTKSDAGYTAAQGFYTSNSGFYDELAWSGVWLYKATGDSSYLENAKSDYQNGSQDYVWAVCWDDVHIGAALLMARETGDKFYKDAVEKNLDWWTTGTAEGERITYTPKGLAWLDNWGALRYATTMGYVASVYSQWDGCDAAKSKTYWDFAVSQAGYALGDTGFSYEIGFGENYPHNPHHRTAQGSYCDNMNEPQTARHILVGALVGGPDSADNYTDEVSNYVNNEVACDYNAGFTGLLAKLYSVYHGKTIKDFGAVEEITATEMYAQGGINVDGDDFIELRVFVCNASAWPARVPKNLEFRYYMDLSEVYAAGGSAENIVISTNYMQGGQVDSLTCWDEEKHIYYMSVNFADDLIYPGGQDKYKKEIQVRIRNTGGVWDNTNDPSFYNMTNGGSDYLTKSALYEDGVLVFGEEPASGEGAGQVVEFIEGNPTNNGQGAQAPGASVKGATAKNEQLSINIDYSGMQQNSSSIAGTMNIKNESDGSLSLKDLKINYYFTNDNDKSMNFSCYHAAINGASGSYTGVSGCSGSFTKVSKGETADTLCEISFSDNLLIEKGDTLTVNFCINPADWTNFTTTNDYSLEKAEHVCIYTGSKLIFGEEP